MALSKQWTLERIEGILRNLSDQLAPNKIEPLDIIDYIHIAVTKTAERLGLSTLGDYTQATAVSVVTLAAASGIVLATSYSYTTKTVTKAAHGLSVGDTLIYWDDGGYYAIGYVATVPSSSTFTVSQNIGVTVTNFKYLKVTPHSTDTVDISGLGYGVDQIVKLSDSISGLCVPKPTDVLDDLTYPQKQGKIHYYRRGETLVLRKGSDVSAYGTLTLEYVRSPMKVTTSTDYLDIKDKYISLIIDVAKLLVYEAVNAQPPEQLSKSVEERIGAFAQENLKERVAINAGQLPG